MKKLDVGMLRNVNITVFALAALIHLLRVFLGKEMPIWASYVAVVVLAVMFWLNYQNK